MKQDWVVSGFFLIEVYLAYIILVSRVQHNNSKMITKLSPVNICRHTSLKKSFSLFLMMRTFKIYSISNFQACNTLLLTIVTTLYSL